MPSLITEALALALEHLEHLEDTLFLYGKHDPQDCPPGSGERCAHASILQTPIDAEDIR
jgi:hypothetical protein